MVQRPPMSFLSAALTLLLPFAISAASAQSKDSVQPTTSAVAPHAPGYSAQQAESPRNSAPAKDPAKAASAGAEDTGPQKTQEGKSGAWWEIVLRFIAALSPYAWPAVFVIALSFLGRDLTGRL